jgi:hypothetical protein
LTPEALHAARLAEEAIRAILRAGEAPDPPTFAREYAAAEARLVPGKFPVPARSAPDAHSRRVAGLLAASLAALGAAVSPSGAPGESCIDIAARILAGADPLELAEEVERAIAGAAAISGEGARSWRDVLVEALRHLIGLLPAAEPIGEELARARRALLRARGVELSHALEVAHRVLSRSILGG